MKTLQSITKWSFILLSLCALSCSSDDDDAVVVPTPVNNNPNGDSFITAKVNGNNFSTYIFGVTAATCNLVNPGDEQLITILGGDLAANNITINLWNVTTTGTITVNRNTNSLMNYTPGSGGVAYATSAECDNATGTINITYIDDLKVEGTFSFTGVNTDNCDGGSKTVTEGKFRGTFPQ